MKLEHLLQAYKQNNINVDVKDTSYEEEKAGIINFEKGISAAYLLDNEDIVITIKIFLNCLTNEQLTISNQLQYIIKVLKIMQNTMILLSNITQEESNMILDKLGLFNNTFVEGKQIKHIDHSYKIEVIEGLLCLSIEEIKV